MAEHGKFGRKQPYPEWAAPRLHVEDFLDLSTVTPSAVIDFYSHVTDWGMLLNDQIGDCTAAAMLHAIQAWTDYASTEFVPTDAEALKIYEDVTGYTPTDPSTDQGAVVQDVLDYWHTTGVNGHTIVAFAQLQTIDRIALRQALEVFGAVYLGINCPVSALDQFHADQPWSYVSGSPIAGGHAVVMLGWDTTRAHPATVITWGKPQEAGPYFLEHYVEEAWVPISQDFIDAQGVTPTYGFNEHQLAEDYVLLTGKPFPGWPSQPNPVPAPVPVAAKAPPNTNPGCLPKWATRWLWNIINPYPG